MRRAIVLICILFYLGVPKSAISQVDSLQRGTFKVTKYHILLGNQADSNGASLKNQVYAVRPGEAIPECISVSPQDGCKIVSFEMAISANGILKLYVSNSNCFSSGMLGGISMLTGSGYIVIENVHIILPDGQTKIIPGETIVITNK